MDGRNDQLVGPEFRKHFPDERQRKEHPAKQDDQHQHVDEDGVSNAETCGGHAVVSRKNRFSLCRGATGVLHRSTDC